MEKEIENNGFIALSDIKIKNITEGEMFIELKDKHLNPHGFAHGGLIYTLADTAMGVSLIDIGQFVTVNSNINFLKPAKCKKLISKVEKVKAGKNIAVLNCNIYNEKKELIATITGTYYKYNKKGKW